MEEYNKLLNELSTDNLARMVIKNNYGKSIDEIYNLIQMEYIKHTSHSWFAGDIVCLYPSIKEARSQKPYDSVYGAYIGLNEIYINYHALFVNISNKSKFVLREPLRFEITDELPMSIISLEELEKNAEVDIPIRRVRSN